jgi:hypothetical protein
MSSVSSILTIRTAGTGLPVPPTTTTPPPTAPLPVPPPTTTIPPIVEPTISETTSASLRQTTFITTQPGKKTLLLDSQRWDLVTDANGNIAVASPPYAMAQDAASAIRLFQGELWYNTTQGVPYFERILGKQPPLSVLKNAFVTAATSVPNVESAQVFFTSIATRRVTGQVQLTTTAGTKIAVTGELQTAPLTDSGGNQMFDSAGNLMFALV